MESDQIYENGYFDSVKSEKMTAMENYNRFKKIKTLLMVIEAVIALTLISWSSSYLPQALKVSGDVFTQVTDYLFKPHVVFLIGNAIVVALVVLCRENDGGNGNSSVSGDIYDEYVHLSQDNQRKPVSVVVEADKISPTSPATVNVVASSAVEEKQIVCVVAPVEKKEDKKAEDEKAEDEKSTAVTAAVVNDATEDVHRFKRTRSARVKKEIPATPRGFGLRRSETCRRRAEATSFESVESLSNEEFNLTVAAFIKRHQEFLLSQKLAENQSH